MQLLLQLPKGRNCLLLSTLALKLSHGCQLRIEVNASLTNHLHSFLHNCFRLGNRSLHFFQVFTSCIYQLRSNDCLLYSIFSSIGPLLCFWLYFSKCCHVLYLSLFLSRCIVCLSSSYPDLAKLQVDHLLHTPDLGSHLRKLLHHFWIGSSAGVRNLAQRLCQGCHMTCQRCFALLKTICVALVPQSHLGLLHRLLGCAQSRCNLRFQSPQIGCSCSRKRHGRHHRGCSCCLYRVSLCRRNFWHH
mmetsp:Transcript_58504/g.136713  ORF Transcript_58504/g.136713 Transcript_58504/m.136713 type:complete len:245 (+) Transcript_58504:4366-5100(+)